MIEDGKLSVSGSTDQPLLSVTARFLRAAGLVDGKARVIAADGAVLIVDPDAPIDDVGVDVYAAGEEEPVGRITADVDQERVEELDQVWESVTGEAIAR